jgi:hypothetical protein
VLVELEQRYRAVLEVLKVPAWTNYRSLIDLYVKPRIGSMQLGAVNASTLNALYGDLLAGGGQRVQLLAGYLGRVVRAATATREVGVWATALPCRRRPGRHACPGRLLV